jgi:UDP-GlcNAc:undecaprenyl-phosphate GlcNAc-1-phosphate transferase
MDLFSSFFVALLTSMVLIPVLMRLSPRLRLVDHPGERKVHAVDVPRVGGIAIAAGAITPVLIWLPLDDRLVSLLAGGAILLAFGLLDDRIGLDYRWKLAGQLLAAAVVMYGGLLIRFVPFGGLDPISPWISVPLTALFLVGVTNAVNLSDGLDGLAAGVSLITLGGIGWLAFQAGAYPVALVVLALIGGICGFLRYNDYPAVVFMGDSGSQFLGFMTASLTLILTQDVHQALSPALLLILLGVPILDTLSVMVWRMRAGVSPFAADNRHFHHRLLALGFRHHEAVSTIYAVHALLVVLAVLLRYETDLIVVSAYCACSAAILAALRLARVSDWRLRSEEKLGQLVHRRPLLRHFDWLPGAVAAAIAAGMAAFLLAAVIFAPTIGSRLAWLVTAAGVVLLAIWVFVAAWRSSVRRAAVYLASVVAVSALAMAELFPIAEWVVNLWTVLLAGLVVAGIRLGSAQEFSATPLDLLIVFVLLALLVVPVFSAGAFAAPDIGLTAVRVAVLYYGTEVLLSRPGPIRSVLPAVAAISLLVFAVRGLL